MWLVGLLLGAFVVSAQAQERNKAQGFCEQGGQTVSSGGVTSSTKVQRTYTGCTVTVFNAGTAVLATIYSDSAGTPKANPFTADASTGAWFFYGLVGEYDVQFSGVGISPTFTRGDWIIPSASAGGGGAVGGTGTLNFIPRWTSTTNIGDSVMSQSGTTITTAGSQVISGGTTPLSVTQGAASSGSPNLFAITGGAHTGLAADTEAVDFNWNLSRTVQFTAGGGSFALQRAIRIQSPTYSSTSAETITDAALIDIESPKAGTNLTITNGWAMRVSASAASHGGILFDHPINATGNSISWRINGNTVGQIKMALSVANFVLGNAQLSPTTTDGFVYLPSMNGTPINTPTAFGQTVPITVDTANQRLYAYMGGAWVNLTSSGSGPSGVANELQYRISGATFGAVTNSNVTSIGEVFFGTVSRTSGPSASLRAFGAYGPSDSGLNADTESVAIQFGGLTNSNSSNGRQFTAGGGTFTNQCEIHIINPTYSFTSADTISFASTMTIFGAPVAGTNATLTNTYALWVDSGKARFDGGIGGPDAVGTNQSGSNLVLGPGVGSGTGAQAMVTVKYPLTTASGTGQQVLSTGEHPMTTNIYRQITDAIILNTGTETAVIVPPGVDGSLATIEGGMGRVGRTFVITATGGFNGGTATTMVIRPKLGGVTVGSLEGTNTVTIAANDNGRFRLKIVITIQTVGASATVNMEELTFWYQNTGSTNPKMIASNGQWTAVDLTTNKLIELTGQFTGTTTTCAWQVYDLSIDIVH